MEFLLESVSSLGVRCGKLITRTGNVLETPNCLLYTRGAAVPNVPQDFGRQVLPNVFGSKNTERRTHYHAVQITLPTLYEIPGVEVLHAFKEGIHKFANLQGQLLYLSVQDQAHPPPGGYNERKTVSIWSAGGRKKVSLESYLEFVKVCKPDIFESFCDTPSKDVKGFKRIQKSVDRTLAFLDQTFEKLDGDIAVFGAVEGSDITSERKRSAKETSKRPVSGFVLEGFDHLMQSKGKEIVSETTAELPNDKPRVLPSISCAGDIFEALEAGIDLVDGSYPYVLSEKGQAIQWSAKGELFESNSTNREPMFAGVLDLAEDVYSYQHSPLVVGCPCYTCDSHTRSYLHHLLKTKEMLAGMLLMIHNLHQYVNFFIDLKAAVKKDNYLLFKSQFL